MGAPSYLYKDTRHRGKAVSPLPLTMTLAAGLSWSPGVCGSPTVEEISSKVAEGSWPSQKAESEAILISLGRINK